MSAPDHGERRDRYRTSPTPVGVHDAALSPAPTALPSVFARIVAFGAIVVSAVCGGLVGYAISALECSRGCAGPSLAGAAIGALAAAAGVAAIAVLVLRSMSEWADQASVTSRRRGRRFRRLGHRGWRLGHGTAGATHDSKAVRR